MRAGGGGDGGVGVRGRHGSVASADGLSAAEIQAARPRRAELSQANRGRVESGNSGEPGGGGEEENTGRAAGDERPGRRKRKRSPSRKGEGLSCGGPGGEPSAGSRDPPVSSGWRASCRVGRLGLTRWSSTVGLDLMRNGLFHGPNPLNFLEGTL